MTDAEKQTTNQEIAEACVAQGLPTELVMACDERGCDGSCGARPYDFTDPRYLLPALEAYARAVYRKTGHLWTMATSMEVHENGILYQVQIFEDHYTMNRRMLAWKTHTQKGIAEMAAFHSALTEGVTE